MLAVTNKIGPSTLALIIYYPPPVETMVAGFGSCTVLVVGCCTMLVERGFTRIRLPACGEDRLAQTPSQSANASQIINKNHRWTPRVSSKSCSS